MTGRSGVAVALAVLALAACGIKGAPVAPEPDAAAAAADTAAQGGEAVEEDP